MSKATKLLEGESFRDGKLHITESYIAIANASASGIANVLTEAKSSETRTVLKPRIEAIHAGRTRNNNIYPAEKLRGDRTFKDENGSLMPSGVHSFTMPYPKPMVIDHYTSADNCTGRIVNAQFVKDAVTNKEMIVIIPEITSEDAVEKILDGRYLTVSVGVSTDSAICNICGNDIINNGWCDHEKGEVYDGVKCGWIIGNIWFDECSWVAVPADTSAKVVDKGEVTTIETYMEVGESVYDLSASSILAESAASTLGLANSAKQPEGGLNEVKKGAKVTVEEAPIEEALVEEAPVETAEETTIEATVEETTPTDTKTTEEQEKPVVEEEDINSQAAIAQKDAEIETLVTEKATLESSISTLKAKITELEAEKQELLDQKVEASASAFKDLVEKVVDLKIGLCKPGVENREEAISEYLERSEESLKDSYKDLVAELKVAPSKAFVPETLDIPGIALLEGEANTETEGQTSTHSDPPVKDASEILKNLLTGNYRKQ